MVSECVDGLAVGLKVEFGFPVVTACVVCVCVCEGCVLRIELEAEIGCSAAGALVMDTLRSVDLRLDVSIWIM